MLDESVLSYISGNLRTHCHNRDRDCLVEKCPFLPFFLGKPCKYVSETLWRNYFLTEDPMHALLITAKEEMDRGNGNLTHGLGLYKMKPGTPLEGWMTEFMKMHKFARKQSSEPKNTHDWYSFIIKGFVWILGLFPGEFEGTGKTDCISWNTICFPCPPSINSDKESSPNGNPCW